MVRKPLEERLAAARAALRPVPVDVPLEVALARLDAMEIPELRALIRRVFSSIVIRPAVRGRNFFDPGRVMMTLRLRDDLVYRFEDGSWVPTLVAQRGGRYRARLSTSR